jgi:DNA-binding NarL/FixJ family response regulator
MVTGYHRALTPVEAWREAYQRGIAGKLCDRIVLVRDVPPRLVGAIANAKYRKSVQHPKDPKVYALSRREREVLYLLSVGWNNAGVAEALGISIDTVKSHVKHILHRLDAKNVTQAVAIGIRHFEII